jgi:hypothetical protein
MISFLVTIILFPAIGCATAIALRAKQPRGIASRLGLWFLLGVGANGTILFVLGILHAPLARLAYGSIPFAAVIAIIIGWRSLAIDGTHEAGAMLPAILLGLPLVAWLCMAIVLPVRDYDGRATWLPKARAIVLEHSIDGPYFQGLRGLNLHNHYPLLLPLDAASVMHFSGSTDSEVARWLYVLIPSAMFLAAYELVAGVFGSAGAYALAAGAWLPIFAEIDGGALAAYSDCAVAAFTGMAVLYAMRAASDPSAARLVGAALGFAVLTKNEGVVIAVAVICSLAIAGRGRGVLIVALPPLVAVLLLLYWRQLIPAAYDEQYAVLVRDLPHMWRRAPAAAHAFVAHAADMSVWAWFWPAAALGAIATLLRDARKYAVPLLTVVLTLGAYVMALTVTSWDITELASVASNRLLLHVLMPACCLVAGALRAVTGK